MKESQVAKLRRRLEQQKTAYLLKKYLVDADAERAAVKSFTKSYRDEHGMFLSGRRKVKKDARAYLQTVDSKAEDKSTRFSPEEKEKLVILRQALTTIAEKEVEEKKGRFSRIDRTRLAIRVGVNFDRLSKEDRIELFKTGGYDDAHMPIDMRQRAGVSTIAAVGVLALEEIVRGVAVATDFFQSAIAKIPEGLTTTSTWVAIGAYTTAYALYILKNLRFAEVFGKSANPLATTVDATAKNLLSKKASDAIAVATAVGIDGFFHTLLFGGILGAAGEPGRIIAANAILAAFNTALVVSGEGVLRTVGKRRLREITEREKDEPQQDSDSTT